MIHPIENWRAYDDNGVMCPWYTRPCLEWLDKLDLKGWQVFEYGCGASSLWYLSRGADINGVDSNSEWLFLPEDRELGPCQWVQTEKKKYLESSGHDYGGFDLIIIDGDYRDDCTEHALKHLKKGGYLICDNFEQPSADLAHWPKTRELTKNMPLTIYKEPLHDDWQTAVWNNV